MDGYPPEVSKDESKPGVSWAEAFQSSVQALAFFGFLGWVAYLLLSR